MMLMDEKFTTSLRNAGTVDEFLDIIDRADEEKRALTRGLQIITSRLKEP